MQAEHWYDAIDVFGDAMPAEGSPGRRDVTLWRVFAYARARREAPVEQIAEALREEAATVPLTPQEEARLLVAEAWLEWHEEAFGRAVLLARRALGLDPRNPDAHVILGGYDELQHRDPTEHFRAAIAGDPPSVQAMGMLAAIGEMDAERCALGRRYMAAAPEGSQASAVRERVRTCPAAAAAR